MKGRELKNQAISISNLYVKFKEAVVGVDQKK